jgi:hypothetical protein
MIIRTLRKVSIEVSSFVLFFLLAFGSQSASIARECTCRNIGAGICVPDPLCLNMLSDVIEKAAQSHGKEINATVLNTGKTIEKAAQDTGKAIEKATQHTGMTIGKAAHDTGKTVEKSSAEVGNALAKQRIDLKNAILNQAADVEETVDWYGKAIANTVVTDK